MSKKIISFILAVLMILSCLTASAAVGGSASGGTSGGGGSSSGVFLSGKINLPDGYVFNGREEIELYVSESYDSWGYEYYSFTSVNADGTYSFEIPLDLIGNYAVSINLYNFSAPVVDGGYDYDKMVQFTGGNIAGIDFVAKKGYTISGKVLFDDVVVENAAVSGFITAYKYDGTFLNMEEIGEGEFYKSFNDKSTTFDYSLTVPEDAGDIVVVLKARCYNNNQGAMKSNVIEDYVYYAGNKGSTLNYKEAEVVTVNGDVSGIDISLKAGVGFSVKGMFPSQATGYSKRAIFSIADKNMSVIHSGECYFYSNAEYASVVLPPEYMNEEVYIYYDLVYSDDYLYSDRLFINPDSSVEKDQSKAKLHTLSAANSLSFTLGLKTDFASGIKGKISFEEGCDLGKSSFNCTITAENTSTYQTENIYIYEDEIGEYEYFIPVTEEGKYKVYARISCYDEESNISECTYYYNSAGTVYTYDKAEEIDIANSTSVDFEFKKLKKFKGQIVADEKIEICDNFNAEIQIYTDENRYSKNIKVDENGNFEVLIPVNIYGKCSAYVHIGEGSNIIPGYYYYGDGSGSDEFDIDFSDSAERIEFNVKTGKVISGKFILPENAEVNNGQAFDVGVGTLNYDGSLYRNYNLLLEFAEGEREKEFMFALPEEEFDEYVLWATGSSNMGNSNIYDEIIYYAEDKTSSIKLSDVAKFTNEGQENIEFYAVCGRKTAITVKNPQDGNYARGNCTVETDFFKKQFSFYLYGGNELSKNMVITDELLGEEAYVYYTLNDYSNVTVYVNPDGSITTKKSEAVKHKITNDTSFVVNISADESIYKVPPIKGVISFSDTGYVYDEYNEPTNIICYLYVYKNSEEVYDQRLSVSKEENASFEASLPEEGEYKLSIYLNRPWGSSTNFVCNETLWYTENGWSLNEAEAKIINNSSVQNLELVIPEVPTIKGTIKFPEEAYTESRIPVIITAVSIDGREGMEFVEYLDEINDVDFSVSGIYGVEKYNLKVQFGYSYTSYDTNLPTGEIFYYTEDGLSSAEDAEKKVVEDNDVIEITAPVNETIMGTISFPEGAKLSDYTNVTVYLYDENSNRIGYKEYNPDNTEAFDFKLNGSKNTSKYRVEVYVGTDETSNLENGWFYLTSDGLTGSNSVEEYFTTEEIKNAQIVLREKRYIKGKIYASDYKAYGEVSDTVRIGFTSGYMTTYRDASLDENLNFVAEIPHSIYGEGYISIQVNENDKNNVIKNEYFYYADANGNKKPINFSSEDISDIFVEVETGNVLSGKLILPEDAQMSENGNFNAYVYYGYSNYSAKAVFEGGKKEADFFMVLPDDFNGAYGLYAYVSNASGVCPNLYIGYVYYTKNGSTVYENNADEFAITSDITDIEFYLLTGFVYEFNFSLPSDITNSEGLYLYAEVNKEKFSKSLSLSSSKPTTTVNVVFPEEYNGKEAVFYYQLVYTYNNELYREKVYINTDEELAIDVSIADKHSIDGENHKIDVTLAKLSELNKPEYEFWTQYPYKNSENNVYSYEYSGEEEIDYLKVAFSDECYLAYRDSAYIYYGDGQRMGPYKSDDLAGKTINIPGDKFSIEINSVGSETAFGIAAKSIEGKKFTIETDHPYTETIYPYTYSKNAEGLRIYFEDTVYFSGSMQITYTDKDGEQETDYYSYYDLSGRSIDIRGNSFTITLPANSGGYYGFSITDIEPIEYHNVTFKNYDGEVLEVIEVENGDSIEDTYYYFEDPTRERDEKYIYTFKGWDKSLENITSDMDVYAIYHEYEYYTVEFKEAEESEVIYTAYVIKGNEAEYDSAYLPVKASTEEYGYVFKGWNIDLTEINSDCTALAVFDEREILVQSEHPYDQESVLEYTFDYEGSADSLILEFSSDTVFGDGDRLYIYSDDYVQRYEGRELSSGVAVIPGKNVRFVIKCNSLQGGNGFALVGVKPQWHEFSDWYTYIYPECLTEGYQERWCYLCDKTEEREIKPLGHSFGVWENEYDEYNNETGVVFRECVRCNEQEIFEGDLNHCSIVNLKIVDAVTMKPLSNVSVTAYDENGSETVFYTNDDGTASQMLLKGTNNLVVYCEDYIMRNISIKADGVITNVPVLGLTQKPAVECKLEAKIMDMEEIKAAGIDTTDPLNSHVYKYSINLGFGEEQTVYFNKEGDYIERGGKIVVHDDEKDITATIHPVNERYYLVIYGQAKWLKEMFDVELVALNTSNTDTIENLTAEIILPEGMSLATMDREAQSDVHRMGTLKSNESKSVHWYVRGDEKGEYNISAKLTGNLMPFDEQFCYEYSTDEPVKVYAGDALEMNIVVPSTAAYGEDYTVKIEIQNVSDRTIYNLTNSTDKIVQSKFLYVDEKGYEKYFEENALGYVKVDELKPGEKIVSEIKSNILFESETIKKKIENLASRLKDETDIAAIFNAYKSTLDLLNDNYDIVYNALGNTERSLTHISDEKKESAVNLKNVLSDCEVFIKDGVSSRAMYFINRLKQENTFEELTKLSKDANYYTVWTSDRIQKLADEIELLYEEATTTDQCADYDVYENIKRVVGAVPVSFWLDSAVVLTLEGSTTSIPYKVTVVPGENHIGITNISNYYYNILSNAIEKMSKPSYTQIHGDIRDKEGVMQVADILKAQVEENLIFEVTDVTGDTRFNAWVEGEYGAKFEISSTAENAGVTEGGITFTGPSYLMVSSEDIGKGTLYVEKVDDVSAFARNNNVYSFKIETVQQHICSNDKWTEVVSAYDDIDGYEAKYCSVCGVLMDMRTIEAKDECSSGSFVISEGVLTNDTFKCKMSFDAETPARSAKALIVMKNKDGVVVHTGSDDIKIKPDSTVDIEIPVKDVEYEEYKILLWDNFMKLRPVANN